MAQPLEGTQELSGERKSTLNAWLGGGKGRDPAGWTGRLPSTCTGPLGTAGRRVLWRAGWQRDVGAFCLWTWGRGGRAAELGERVFLGLFRTDHSGPRCSWQHCRGPSHSEIWTGPRFLILTSPTTTCSPFYCHCLALQGTGTPSSAASPSLLTHSQTGLLETSVWPAVEATAVPPELLQPLVLPPDPEMLSASAA